MVSDHGSIPVEQFDSRVNHAWKDVIYLSTFSALRNYISSIKGLGAHGSIISKVRPTETLLHQPDTLFDPLAIENDEWLIRMLHDLWIDGYLSDAWSDLEVILETLGKAGW